MLPLPDGVLHNNRMIREELHPYLSASPPSATPTATAEHRPRRESHLVRKAYLVINCRCATSWIHTTHCGL